MWIADYCELELNECDAAGCDYDATCHPTSTDNCIGFFVPTEQLIYDTCVNGTLNFAFWIWLWTKFIEFWILNF